MVSIGGVIAILATLRVFSPRSGEFDAQRDMERDTVAAIEEGQEAFAELAMTPLASFGSSADALAHLAAAAPRAPEESESRDVLLEKVADLVYYHFVQGSPATYRAWRESQGYRFKDAESMRRESIDRDYEHWFDEPYPGNGRLVDVFDRLWTATLSVRDERSRPVAMATDGAGVAMSFGVLDREERNAPPTLSGALPSRVWEGRRQAALGRIWWTDPNGGIHRERQHRASVPIAVVGVVLEMKAGDRYPLSFTFYQDAAGSWWLWRVNVHNFPVDRFVQLEF